MPNCGFGNFSCDFYFAIFSLKNYSRVLKFARKLCVVGHFSGLKIGALCISCERQINVMQRIAAHAVRQLKGIGLQRLSLN